MEEVVMAAAHAYDLRGAQRIWIRTEKVERVKKVKKEFDVFSGDMGILPDEFALLEA